MYYPDFSISLFASGLIQKLMALIQMIPLSQFHQMRYGLRYLNLKPTSEYAFLTIKIKIIEIK